MNHKVTGYVFAFLMPVLLYLIVMIGVGFYPFGDCTIVTWDMQGQYLAFLAYFRRILLGQENFFFTQSMTLGGANVGLLAYYTLSPFNLILIFFQEEQLPIVLLIIIIMKIAFTGLSMYFFLNYNMKLYARAVDAFITVIFSTAYAFCGYMINMQFNIMWLDGVILLPLVAYGIQRLLRDDKSIYFILSIVLAILTNFYIGYMICIFAVVYFIGNILGRKPGKQLIMNIVRFIISALLAGGLCAVLLLPLIYNLSLGSLNKRSSNVTANIGSYMMIFILLVGILLFIACRYQKYIKNTVVLLMKKVHRLSDNYWLLFGVVFIVLAFGLFLINKLSWKGIITKDLVYIPTKLLIGAFNADEVRDGLPNIWVPSGIVVLLYVYISDSSIKNKRKNLFLLVILYLSMLIRRGNWIWHGMAYPHGSNYRYSFMLSFVLIVIGYEVLLEKDKLISYKQNKKAYLVTGVILSLWIAFCCYKVPEIKSKYITNMGLVLTVLFYIISVIMLLFGSARRKIWMVMSMAGIEMVCNAGICLSTMDYLSMSQYEKDICAMNNVKQYIDPDGFYRIEQPDGGANDGLLYGYDSLSHYSSLMLSRNADFLEPFGLLPPAMSQMEVMYNNKIDEEVAGRLGIRYIITKKPIECTEYQLRYICDLDDDNKRYIYENPYFEGMAYVIPSSEMNKPMERVLDDMDGTDVLCDQETSKIKYKITIEVNDDSTRDSNCVLSIADDIGWNAVNNGKQIEIEEAFGNLISVPIEKGKNHIELEYTLPWLKEGIICSCLFGILTIVWLHKEKRLSISMEKSI